MKHSNRQEMEEYFDEEAVQGKNGRDEMEDDYEEERDSGLKKVPCCLFSLFIVVGSLFLVYYVFSQIKTPLMNEWDDNKGFFEKVPEYLDRLKADVKENKEAGHELIETSKKEKAKLDQAIETIDTVSGFFDSNASADSE